MRSRKPLTLTCLALALALGACGSDGDGGGGSDKAPSGGEPTGSKPTPGATIVDMKNVKNMPQKVTVQKVGTVRWTNSDSFAHTVTKEDGPGEDFDSGNIDGGGAYERKFTAAGTVAYICTIHPNQTGSVVVE